MTSRVSLQFTLSRPLSSFKITYLKNHRGRCHCMVTFFAMKMKLFISYYRLCPAGARYFLTWKYHMQCKLFLLESWQVWDSTTSKTSTEILDSWRSVCDCEDGPFWKERKISASWELHVQKILKTFLHLCKCQVVQKCFGFSILKKFENSLEQGTELPCALLKFGLVRAVVGLHLLTSHEITIYISCSKKRRCCHTELSIVVYFVPKFTVM